MIAINKKSPVAVESIEGQKNSIFYDYNTAWQNLVEESRKLTKELMDAEYLFEAEKDPLIKDELRLNILDINTKLDQLRLESDRINDVVGGLIDLGVLRWRLF